MNYIENVIQRIYSFLNVAKSTKIRLSTYRINYQSHFRGEKVQYIAQRVDGKKVPLNRKL